MSATDWPATLSIWANIAQVSTGIVALAGSFWFFGQRMQRRWQLETYLEKEQQDDARSDVGGTGARSVLHLAGRLGMAEQQVIESANSSKRLGRLLGTDENGKVDRLFYQFKARQKKASQPSAGK
ncbi:hypothetical protein [Phenylobacterium sp.]|uniref:hypothetical protein n=1 Tax=Phenylobacterium sp. TaxID=1871053 RepID=UPI003569370E